MCLPRRHNAVAKEIYSKLLKKDTKKKKTSEDSIIWNIVG